MIQVGVKNTQLTLPSRRKRVGIGSSYQGVLVVFKSLSREPVGCRLPWILPKISRVQGTWNSSFIVNIVDQESKLAFFAYFDPGIHQQTITLKLVVLPKSIRA